MNNTYEALINHGQYNQQNTGVALANSTSATDISPGANLAGQALTFPAGYFQPGQALRVTADGIISNTGTPTLNLGLYLGGVAGTALATTGAIATIASLANNLWRLEARIRVVTTGTSGSMIVNGSVTGPYASSAFMPATSPSGNLVSSLATGSQQILTIGATWGAASASNSVQIIQFNVERLNEGGS